MEIILTEADEGLKNFEFLIFVEFFVVWGLMNIAKEGSSRRRLDGEVANARLWNRGLLNLVALGERRLGDVRIFDEGRSLKAEEFIGLGRLGLVARRRWASCCDFGTESLSKYNIWSIFLEGSNLFFERRNFCWLNSFFCFTNEKKG